MFRAVVLLITAAGRSSRMGKAKGTVKIGKHELLETHIDNFKKAFPSSPVYLVVGHHIAEYSHYADKVKFIQNENYELGQFSSISIGLHNLPEVTHAQVLLQPVDLAPVPPDIYLALVTAAPEKEVVKPVYNNKSGHPILLRGEVLKSILSAPPTQRLDQILKDRHLSTVKWIEVTTENITTNLNSPQELRAYIKDNL